MVLGDRPRACASRCPPSRAEDGGRVRVPRDLPISTLPVPAVLNPTSDAAPPSLTPFGS